MASEEANYRALKATFKELLSRFGILTDAPFGNTPEQPFDRLWFPPDAAIGLDHPTGLGCYRELPRDPRLAVRVQCNQGFTLTLDSEWTTPQALIGIKFGAPPQSRTDCVVLVPGQTLEVPSGFTEFWAYAADHLDLFPWTPAAYNLVGYVSFIVGRTIGAKPAPRHPHPLARVLSIAPAAAGTPTPTPAGFIPNGNFKYVRIRAGLTDAVGTAIAGNFIVSYRQNGVMRVNFNNADAPIFLTETPDSGIDLGTLIPEFVARPLLNNTTLATWYTNLAIPYGIATLPVVNGPVLNYIDWWWCNSPGVVNPRMNTVVSASDEHDQMASQTLWEDEGTDNATYSPPNGLPIGDYDELLFVIDIVGAAPAGAVTIDFFDVTEAGAIRQLHQTSINAGVAAAAFGWGRGAELAYNMSGPGPRAPIPKAIYFTIGVVGAASHARVRITGHRYARP